MLAEKRISYHTHIKHLAREGLLSRTILKQIPRTNIYRWKGESDAKHKTFDLNGAASCDYELVKAFLKSKSAKRVFTSYVRLIKAVVSVAHRLDNFHRSVKENSKAVVDIILRVKDYIGLKRTLRFFNISVPTFRNWLAQTHTSCFESLTNSCNRIFPSQLSRPEVVKLKELLTDQRFQYWPVSSIAYHTLRKNILPVSLNTWYKYANKLGLTRPKPTSRRKKNAVSVRAERPHQIWHADITVFATADNVKHYIYAVIDNYSRKILSWLIANTVQAEHRKKTIEEALKNVRQNHHCCVTLITDGGPENKLKTFLDSLEHSVDHKVALVDVHYSNSLIEASFKTAKYYYLYRMNIPNGNALKKAFTFTVEDFNERPHVSLKGLTPNEAEKNVTPDEEPLHVYIKTATEKRKKYNQTHRCSPCKE